MADEVIATANADATALPDAESAGVEAQPGSDVQAVLDADPAKPAAKPVEEDPEIEFDKDFKLKKSEAANALRKRKELDRAAFAKFEEAAKIRKQLESLRESDPEEFFKLRGIDPLEYAIQKLQREVALKEATPEQRALMEAQAKIQALEAERQQFQTQREQQEDAAVREQFVAKLDKELPAAVQKFGLPTDPVIFRSVAGVIADQLRSGIPEDAEAAAEVVADAYRATFKTHAATLKYEDAVKQYPEFVKLIREGDLARARTAPATQRPVPTGAPKKPAAPAQNDGKSFDEYFSKLSGGMPFGI
jgi:hypothetical protein